MGILLLLLLVVAVVGHEYLRTSTTVNTTETVTLTTNTKFAFIIAAVPSIGNVIIANTVSDRYHRRFMYVLEQREHRFCHYANVTDYFTVNGFLWI